MRTTYGGINKDTNIQGNPLHYNRVVDLDLIVQAPRLYDYRTSENGVVNDASYSVELIFEYDNGNVKSTYSRFRIPSLSTVITASPSNISALKSNTVRNLLFTMKVFYFYKGDEWKTKVYIVQNGYIDDDVDQLTLS